MAINFNVEPYYDDFEEDKKFYRVLFRPGYAVQARELTQLQTLLQNQVSRFGRHVFKEGSMVIPGQTSLDTEYHYVKLQPQYNTLDVSTYAEQYVGKIIVGQTSNIRARVVNVTQSTSADPITLYVKYLTSGGNDGTIKVFQGNELIETDETNPVYAFVQAENATGIGSSLAIQRGVYFVNGTFALVEEQRVILDKYNNTPTYSVGLEIQESLVTPEQDSTLLDNAQGTSNFAAPGAHRYKINLELQKRALDAAPDKNFIEIVQVKDGQIIKRSDRTDYSVLMDTIARRTYDESGDYTIKNFNIQLREHRNNDRGLWKTNTSYLLNDVVEFNGVKYVATNSGTSGITAPSHTFGVASDGNVSWLYEQSPAFNRGVYSVEQGGDESKFAVGLEPGKAYVRGYEIEKLGTEYVAIPKARDFNRVADGKVTTTVGNYILVKNLSFVPDISTLSEVTFYDAFVTTAGVQPTGNVVGTARVRDVELHSGTYGSASAEYKISIFNLQQATGKTFAKEGKSMYLVGTPNCTADVVQTNVEQIGTVTVASTGSTITGVGTKFSRDFAVGDFFSVAITGKTYKISAIASDISLTVTATLTSTDATAGSTYNKVYSQVFETQNAALLFPLPYPFIRKIRGADDISLGATYTVKQRFLATAASGTLTITTTGANDTFASAADTKNYMVIKQSGSGTGAVVGAVINPTSVTVVEPTKKQVQIVLPANMSSDTCIVIASVNKTSPDSKEKVKTLNRSVYYDVTAKNSVTSATIILNKADILRVSKIEMFEGMAFGASIPAPGQALPNGVTRVDITSRFGLDNGQRDTFYDLGRITLTPGQVAPTAPIRVYYDYFSHSNGDYFTVDSYLASISYQDIPSYVSTNGNTYHLHDVLDFRPRIDDAGTTFTGSGSSISSVPKRGIDFECDYSYFLPRRDKIYLRRDGLFLNEQGVSSLYPEEPKTPDFSMVLYNLLLVPYTLETNKDNIIIDPIDNRRYTMRDIGDIDRRLRNLENYTTLTLLEKEVDNLQLFDADGFPLFKNGFVVDSFSSQNVGDVTNVEYKCSLDMKNNELRPFFAQDNVNLIEKAQNNTQRSQFGYQATGDFVTLPYTELISTRQQFASRTVSVNPFMVATHLGTISMNPPSDEWFETNIRPDIIINREGNFAAVEQQARQQGILGTVWNNWQTNWSSTSASTTIASTAIGGGWWRTWQTLSTTTTTTTTSQSRTGTETFVASTFTNEVIDDRIVGVDLIPFIRSRDILFVGKNFKFSTKLNAFFDEINVSEHITPASILPITRSNTEQYFDMVTNSGANADEAARRTNGNPNTALNRGDVITGFSSGATAVIVVDSGGDQLMVANVRGTFQVGETITGSISGLNATVRSSLIAKAKGSALLSNEFGDVGGVYTIPNNDTVRFRTGTRNFTLTDSATNGDDYTTHGVVDYTSIGYLQHHQRTILSTRNGVVTQRQVSDTQVTSSSSSSSAVVSQWTTWIGGGDPLAQSFSVEEDSGVFMTKVELFFSAKDSNLPVTFDIREMVNGYPTRTVVPMSTVTLNPSRVAVSQNASLPTVFKFESPVYLAGQTEYCFVVTSDSDKYRMWVSHIGENDIATNQRIAKQPYLGVMFKSQNSSTWIPEDLEDIKFNMYRAKFDTSATAEVEYHNQLNTLGVLTNESIQTKSGSTKIRVLLDNHGMNAGSKVILAGFTPTKTYNGILGSVLNATHTVVSADFDSFVINLSAAATLTGITGEGGATCTKDVRFEVLQVLNQPITLPGTRASYFFKTTSAMGIDGTQTPYQLDSSFVEFIPNENMVFDSPRTIASGVNEENFLSGQKSLSVKVALSSTQDNLSPVIDMARFSVVAIDNRIDNPSIARNVDGLDNRTIVTSNTIAFNGTTKVISSNDSATQNLLKTIRPSRYIRITGATNSANNNTFLVTAVDSATGSVTIDGTLTTESAGQSVTVELFDMYVLEKCACGGISSSKYLTKPMILTTSSDTLKVSFEMNIPTAASVEVYYKTLPAGSQKTLAEIGWTQMSADIPPTYTETTSVFNTASYLAKGIPSYNLAQVKIVMKSNNSAKIPRIRALKVISLS